MMDSALFVDLDYRFSKGGQLKVSFSIALDMPSTTVIFGPSGSGKSTLLHCLAGIETPDTGNIRLGDLDWFNKSKNQNLRPQDRSVGLLFQDYPLFPHLNIFKNTAYGLHGLSKQERKERVQSWMDLFGLRGKENRYPDELSGGERQRAALAQILASQPRLLLLDEPFSALDLHARNNLHEKLRTWIHEQKGTVIMVTHDLSEALAFADRFIILSEGKILQEGSPMDIFSRPALPSVAKIVGIENVLPGKIFSTEGDMLTLAVGKAHLVASGLGQPQQPCFAAIRAEEIVLEIGKAAQSSARNRINGVILEIISHGPHAKVKIDCGFPLTASITQQSALDLSLKAGMDIVAVIKASAIHVLPAP